MTRKEFLQIPGVENKINSISEKFGFSPDSLLTAIENESNFDVKAKNPNSSATGLIQFMDSTAKDLNFDHSSLVTMNELGQLDLVEKYFDRNHKKGAQPYMTIALPAYGNKPLDEVLYDKNHRIAQDNPQWADPDTGHVTRRAIESYGTIPKSSYKEKQQELVNQGYDIGPSGVDGSWGPMTKKAWHQYKRDQEKSTQDIQQQIKTPEPIPAEPDATFVAPSDKPEVSPQTMETIPVQPIPVEEKQPELAQASQEPTMLPEVEVKGGAKTPFNKTETDEQMFTVPSLTDQITDPEINIKQKSIFIEKEDEDVVETTPVAENIIQIGQNIVDQVVNNNQRSMAQGFMQTGGMIPVGGDDGELTYNTIDELEDPNVTAEKEDYKPENFIKEKQKKKEKLADHLEYDLELEMTKEELSIDYSQEYEKHESTVKNWEEDPLNKDKEEPSGVQNAKKQIENLNRLTDVILTHDPGILSAEEYFDAGEYQTQLRKEILKQIPAEMFQKVMSSSWGGAGLTEDVEKMMLLKARSEVLNNNMEIIGEKANALIAEGEKLVEERSRLSSVYSTWQSESMALKDDWNRIIKPTGYYAPDKKGATKWMPNFKNDEQIGNYTNFIKRSKDLEQRRVDINEDLNLFDTKVKKNNDKRDLLSKQMNGLYTSLAYNTQDQMFEPAFSDSVYLRGKPTYIFKNPYEKSSFTISDKFNESLREMAGRDNAWGKAADVLSTALNSYIKYEIPKRLMRTKVGALGVLFTGIGTKIAAELGIGTKDMEEYGLIGGGEYDAFDWFGDQFIKYSRADITPASMDPDSRLFLDKPNENKLFFKTLDRQAGMYQWSKFLIGEVLPFTLSLGTGNVSQRKKLLRMQRLDKIKKAKPGLTSRLGITANGGKLYKNDFSLDIIHSLQKRYKFSDKFAMNALQVDHTFKMLFAQNYEYGKSQGLDTGAAFGLASWMGLATGIVQGIMPDYQWFNTGVGRSIVKTLVESFKATSKGQFDKAVSLIARKKAGEVFIKNVAKEFLEEEADVLVNDIVKSVYLTNHSWEIADLRTQEQLILGTAFVAKGLGTVQAVRGVREMQGVLLNAEFAELGKTYNAAKARFDLIEKEIERLENIEKNYDGSLFPMEEWEKSHLSQLKKQKEQLKTVMDEAFDMAKAMKMAPDYLTVETVNYIREKNNLLEQKDELLKGKDKTAVEQEINEINDKIAAIDDKIRKDSYNVRKEERNKALKERGKKLADGSGFLYHEATSAEEFFEFAKKENARRRVENKKLNLQIDELRNDKSNYDSRGDLKREVSLQIENLLDRKLEYVPETLEQFEGKKAGGMIYYDDVNKKHTIIVDWNMAKNTGNFAVIQHEILHGMLRQTMINGQVARRASDKPGGYVTDIQKLAIILRKQFKNDSRMSSFLKDYVLDKFKTSYDTDGYVDELNADELLTIMSEYMLQNNYRFDTSFLGEIGKIFRSVAREFGVNIVIKDAKDLINFLEDYSREAKRGRFSAGLKKIKKEGLKVEVKLTAKQRTKAQVEAAMAKSKRKTAAQKSAASSIYEENKVLEDLDLKESSKKIIEENARIRKTILEENIIENGKVVASPEMQDALIANNMAAAVQLAKFAAANPNIMALEEGKRVTFDQFLSGYYEQLVALARTYDASVNEFGAYMNTLLPLRYGQILKQEKKGEVEGAVSMDAEGVNEVADTSGMTSRLDQSEESLPKVNVAFQAGGETLQKEYEDHYEKGYLLIKNGPAKNQTFEEWLQELDDLGFVDADGVIFDIYNVNFANLQDLAYNITSKIFGIDPDKLNWKLNAKASKEGKIPAVKFMANLRIDESRGSNELRAAQMAMRKLGLELFVGPVTPEGFVGTTDKPIGPTKIRPVLQKLLYNKGKKKNNVQMYHKFPVVDIKAIEEAIGIVDNKSFRGDRNISAIVHAFANQFGRTVASQSLRNVMAKHGDLTDKLQVALSDGISKVARSAYYKENKDLRVEILEGLEQMSYDIALIIIDDQKDEKEMREKTLELFKKTFKGSKVDYKKLHGQLFSKLGVLSIWATMSVRYEALGLAAPSFMDFVPSRLENRAEEDELFELMDLLITGDSGKYTKSSVFSKYLVEKGRVNLVRIARDLKDKVQKGEMLYEDARLWLSLLGGMYKGASGIANKQFKPIKPGSIRVTLSGDYSSRFRANVTSGAQDYYNLVNYGTNGYFDVKSPKAMGLSVLNDTSKDVIRDLQEFGLEYLDRRDVQADVNRSLYKYLVTNAWKKYGSSDMALDRMMFLNIMFSFGEGMEAPSRKAAKVFGISEKLWDFENNKYIGPSNPGTSLEYDHNKPHFMLITQTINILKNNPESKWDELLDQMFKDFTVNIITKKHNTAIDKAGYQSMAGPKYKVGSDMNNIVEGPLNRSYNEELKGHPDVDAVVEIRNPENRIGGAFVDVKAPNVSKSMQYMEVAKLASSMAYNEKTKGISILDFDDTLATSKSLIRYAAPDGTKGTLTPAQYAKQYVTMADAGYKFDFSEFNEVIDGKVAPLFNKALKLARKFGTENMFVLTARPAESAPAIYEFLKQNGLEIPLGNITGLGNSTGEAKALWIVGKVEEGYNDIYFADDALQNVQAVKNVLEQLDVKSKIQQAKSSKSAEYNEEFNKILEEKSGIGAEKRFSEMKGRKRGQKQGKMKFWIPPSAEDFAGLLYAFLGKGKRGEEQMKFFKKILLDPYNKAITKLNQAKQQMANEYHELLNSFEGMRKRLNESIIQGDFVVEDAIRVYLWDKAGYEIPALSETDKVELVAIVENDEQLLAFALGLNDITRDLKGYTEPTTTWETDGIKHDLFQKSSNVKMGSFLDLFKQNREIVFGKWGGKNGRQLIGPNMNKIEAIYGKKFRQALEDIIWRMENGTNRSYGDNKMVNDFMNWLNGSVAAVMFVNTRSAILQTLSTVNFINWDDNNIFAAARAFSNQEQFWTDFADIFNSDFLKQRRSGLTQDLNASELISHLSKTDNKAKAAIRWLLQKGFAPTQIADSFAIAMGGATFYRNRIGKYVGEGMPEEQAKEKAWSDFQEIAEATQQSARADMISQEQASVLGRLILAFQNTPMQYARLTKKAFLDLINGRGDTKSNISKIIYYSFVQNIIFYALQTGLLALMFGGEDEDEELIDKKQARLWNSMLDSTLRGIGVGGAIVSTLKNMALKAAEQDKKGNRADYAYVLIEFFNLAPPIGIKARKIYSATQSWKWSKQEREEMGILNIDNPVWEVTTGVTEGLFNAPVNRIYNKLQNIRAALDTQTQTWKRIAIILGWNAWSVGVDVREKSSKKRKFGSSKKRKFGSSKKKRKFGSSKKKRKFGSSN